MSELKFKIINNTVVMKGHLSGRPEHEIAEYPVHPLFFRFKTHSNTVDN